MNSVEARNSLGEILDTLPVYGKSYREAMESYYRTAGHPDYINKK